MASAQDVETSVASNSPSQWALQAPDDHFQSTFPEELNLKTLSLATKNFLEVSWNITWSHFAETASQEQHNIKYWIFPAYWKAATTDWLTDFIKSMTSTMTYTFVLEI